MGGGTLLNLARQPDADAGELRNLNAKSLTTARWDTPSAG